MENFPHLAQPLQLGASTLKNRIVHCAILTKFVRNQAPTEAYLTYHENRARGGAAMIVSETVNALRGQSMRPDYLNAYSDKGLSGLSRVADRIRQHDCLLLAQLQDRGRGHYATGRIDHAYGPSALPDDLSGAVPHPLSISQIEYMVDDFSAASLRLQRAGYTGVEISAGHGHLFHQFLSPQSNHRDDMYGRNLEGRIKFLSNVIDAVRLTCGTEFMIGLKLPGEDGMKGGVDLEAAQIIAQAVVTPDTVDYVSFCWGSQSDTLYWHVPDGHSPRIPYADKTAQLRQHTSGVPVMSLGMIVDPNEAERILVKGQADFIGLGRTLIADPAWPNKALSGQGHSIRPCISGNTCWASIVNAGRLHCDNNPALASSVEIDGVSKIKDGAKKIVVVGGGIAGMEAAWVAAARGHQVDLFCASTLPGGRARQASQMPGAEGLGGIFDYQEQAAKQYSVNIKSGQQAGLVDILALTPDVVVLATGAQMAYPSSLPAELEDEGVIMDLPALIADLSGSNRSYAGTAVIIDEDHTIAFYNATLWMADRFDEVVLITSRERFAASETLVNRQGIIERIFRPNITLLPFSELLLSGDNMEEGRVKYRHLKTDQVGLIENVAALSYASHRVPRLDLQAGLEAAGVQTELIGDAFAPRGVLQAMTEGYELAMKLAP
jgi:2,4-dienoyl-CoA reductase-like NADH-dependent reductase (Old Yellow Enzyme family)/thioredoxin reductase